MMKPAKFLYFLTVTALPLLVSCGTGGSNSSPQPQGDTISLAYAKNLAMVDYGSYVKVEMRNPWDTTRVLQSFALVPRGNDAPVLTDGSTVVRVPLERSVVHTSPHASLIDELGALHAVSGMCDARYIMNPRLRAMIDNQEIADCGASTTPNIERILQLKPDAILVSAYENSSDHNKVAQLGIPVIDCADYMEQSPLARAEWMRFYGRLYGKSAEADSLFRATEQAYLLTKEAASNAGEKPSVLFDLIYGQAWNVPGAYSTAGTLISDAGGVNPFASHKRSGSIALAPEKVLYTARLSDVWLIRYMQDAPLTLEQLRADNKLYSLFKAYGTGQVYGCNTASSTYFDDLAFHPHWILAEYARILHPELADGEDTKYFHKIQ